MRRSSSWLRTTARVSDEFVLAEIGPHFVIELRDPRLVH